MNWKTTSGTVAATLFVAAILLANYVTTQYGFISVGFGLTATAGTYFAGMTFILRDTIQDGLGKYAVLALILISAGVSYLDSSAAIATASGVAFLCSETADLLVYTPLRSRGYVRAALASNLVGSIVDTFLFLWVAGFPIAAAWKGQIVGKMTVTVALLVLVLVFRAVQNRRRALA